MLDTLLLTREMFTFCSLSPVNMQMLNYGQEDHDGRAANKSLNIPALEYKRSEPEEPIPPPPVQAETSISPPPAPVEIIPPQNVDLLVHLIVPLALI